MRRYVPFIILGLLTVGTVVGLVLGLSNSHPSSAPSTSSAASNGSVAPPTTSTTSPVGVPASLEACGLITSNEAKTLLNQIVNKPPLAKTPFCSYEGLVTVSPSTRPPALSITAVTNASAVTSAQNFLQNNVQAICGKKPTATCTGNLKENSHTTIAGSPVIYRKTSTTVDGEVGSAYTVKHGTVVVVTVSGLPNAAPLALKAIALAIPRV